ncbi:hypothetical protein B0H13DRAFT_1914947 [Mycena leptocephala]|nr:hypothetical protein B0H13DRAFT_1914947 [Mycena leptocephala]
MALTTSARRGSHTTVDNHSPEDEGYDDDARGGAGRSGFPWRSRPHPAAGRTLAYSGRNARQIFGVTRLHWRHSAQAADVSTWRVTPRSGRHTRAGAGAGEVDMETDTRTPRLLVLGVGYRGSPHHHQHPHSPVNTAHDASPTLTPSQPLPFTSLTARLLSSHRRHQQHIAPTSEGDSEVQVHVAMAAPAPSTPSGAVAVAAGGIPLASWRKKKQMGGGASRLMAKQGGNGVRFISGESTLSLISSKDNKPENVIMGTVCGAPVQQGKYEDSLQCFDHILRNPPSPLDNGDIWFQSATFTNNRRLPRKRTNMSLRQPHQSPSAAWVAVPSDGSPSKSLEAITPDCSFSRASMHNISRWFIAMAEPNVLVLHWRLILSDQQYATRLTHTGPGSSCQGLSEIKLFESEWTVSLSVRKLFEAKNQPALSGRNFPKFPPKFSPAMFGRSNRTQGKIPKPNMSDRDSVAADGQFSCFCAILGEFTMHVMTPVRFKLFEPQIHLGVSFLRPNSGFFRDNPWQELPGLRILSRDPHQPVLSEVWFDLGSLYESCNNQISIPKAQ